MLLLVVVMYSHLLAWDQLRGNLPLDQPAAESGQGGSPAVHPDNHCITNGQRRLRRLLGAADECVPAALRPHARRALPAASACCLIYEWHQCTLRRRPVPMLPSTLCSYRCCHASAFIWHAAKACAASKRRRGHRSRISRVRDCSSAAPGSGSIVRRTDGVFAHHLCDGRSPLLCIRPLERGSTARAA